MKITKKVGCFIILVTLVSLSILFASANFMSLGASTPATATGVVSAVESGTTNTSSWSLGPVPAAEGSSVSVDIRIDGATPKTIWGWAVNNINWNPSVLSLTQVSQGSFLTDSGDQTLMVGNSPSLWNNKLGTIDGGVSCTDSTSSTPQTKDKSGVLATLTFQVIGYGSCPINLGDVLLYTSATASVAVVNYVQVIANNATFTAITPPVSLIQAFTSSPGNAANAHITAYGPQDLVQMYALVTYNQASVANQEVSFSVQNPNGTVVDVRVASTNSTGYAYSDYRLPWPNTDPQAEFGNWSVTATTDLSNVPISSSTNFTYSYVVAVLNTNGIQLPATAARGSVVDINVTIQSLPDQLTWSTVSVTIYDSVNTPIGNFIASNNEAPGSSTVNAQITIPTWAFVGTATVYVDVLSNTPSQDGVPYCPERVANFQIIL